MIGLIGPADSVDLAMSVAAAGGYSDEVIARVYEHVEEAAGIAADLDLVCNVLLFTGRLPYLYAKAMQDLTSELQYIPYSGADLFRCIAQVLQERAGALPLVSIDVIDPAILNICFTELGLPLPAHVGIPDDGELSSERVKQDLIEFHQGTVARHEADLVLTCLSEVHAELQSQGLDVRRIEHSRISVSDALLNARMSSKLHRSRSSQLAVALYQIDAQALARADVYDREAARLRVHQGLLELARKYGGRLSVQDGGSFSLATNRGVIESAASRHAAGHASLLDRPDFGMELEVGFGIGDTFATAETNAKEALHLSSLKPGVHIVFPDGRVLSPGDKVTSSLQLHESGAILDLAGALGIGPLSVRRLLDALVQVNRDAFTPQQLGDAYGVQVRSARRIVSALVRAGYAHEAGVWAHAGAGRPQTLYRVDMKLLADGLDGDSEQTLDPALIQG
jgi:hypothetical protein